MTSTAHDYAPAIAFDLVVRGRPAPQGSKKAFNHNSTGKIITQEMSKYVRPWRQDVRAAAEDALRLEDDPHAFPLNGPLSVDMVFSVERPKSHFGTGRNAGVLKRSAPPYPASMPDLSKLLRSTEDALTSAGVWRDDARVVECGRLAKVYTASGDPDSLQVPGAVIRVRRLEVA